MNPQEIANKLLAQLADEYPHATVVVQPNSNIHIRLRGTLRSEAQAAEHEAIITHVAEKLDRIHKEMTDQTGHRCTLTHDIQVLRSHITTEHAAMLLPAKNVPAYQQLNRKNWWHR